MSIEIALVAAEAKEAAKNCASLEERICAAMRSAKNHWMVLNPNLQFQGAIAAIYQLSNDETKERIRIELEGLKALNALISGIPVDLDAVQKQENPIGLMKFWREAGEDRP